MLGVLFSFLLYTAIPACLPSEMMNNNNTIEPEIMFRNIHMGGNKGSYIVTGETTLNNGITFYSVEDGHIEFLSKKQLIVKRKSLDWATFKIILKIPKDKLPKNGSLILNLYERTSKGMMIHSYPVILERF